MNTTSPTVSTTKKNTNNVSENGATTKNTTFITSRPASTPLASASGIVLKNGPTSSSKAGNRRQRPASNVTFSHNTAADKQSQQGTNNANNSNANTAIPSYATSTASASQRRGASHSMPPPDATPQMLSHRSVRSASRGRSAAGTAATPSFQHGKGGGLTPHQGSIANTMSSVTKKKGGAANLLNKDQQSTNDVDQQVQRQLPFPSAIGGQPRVAFIGNYLPRKCGIANFTHDLRCAIANRYDEDCEEGEVDALVCCVNDGKEVYSYAEEVVMEFEEQSRSSYIRVADAINAANVDVVCVQHEYGIYGGPCGVFLLDLMRALRVPIVTTLHTILADPSSEQRKVLAGILHYSSRVVTMTDTGNNLLSSVYAAPPAKVQIIPHGIPVTDLEPSEIYKKKLGIPSTRRVLLTFGLLSPNKGIEHMIEALPCIRQEFPDVLYVILGQTHPNLIRESGEAYRFKLQHIAKELGVEENIRFVNRYTDLPLLLDFIRACDLYVTPYLHEAQITSGTLSYAYGLGKVVVSTPYWHARDLLGKSGNGRLVDFGSRRGLSREILSLLRDDELRESMGRAAYDEGRTFTWPKTAEGYAQVFADAITSYDPSILNLHHPSLHHTTSADGSGHLLHHLATPGQLPSLPKSPAVAATGPTTMHESLNPEDFETISFETIATFQRSPDLPDINLMHLLRLVDATGIIQHATFAIPNREFGYCTDDCSRTLSTLVRLKAEGYPITERADTAMTTMMSFLLHAFDGSNCRFRNFMSYDRRWIDEGDLGSEDAHGRALQALGCCVRYGFSTDLAMHLFLRAMGPVIDFESPRAVAFSLLGFCQYRERDASHKAAAALQQKLAAKLVDLYDECVATNAEHQWFERSLAYNNGALSSALLYCGVQLNEPRITEVGLESLKWLIRKQVRDSDGAFTPVGSKTFVDGRHERLVTTFDQQPIEASDMVLACVTALEVTKDSSWLQHATTIFDWFMGKNHLGTPLYDPQTGGCHDGLHNDRMNLNQGAESTICYVDSLSCLRYAQVSFNSQQSQHTQQHSQLNNTQNSMKIF